MKSLKRVISFLENRKTIWSILFISACLRLINVNQSLWHDEAITALAARDFNFKSLIPEFIVVDNHTPLYYLLLRFWGLTFGFTDIHLRLFSISIGVLTVYIFYKLIYLIEKDSKKASLGALLLAFSALHVYYSQEIRMYILGCFFAVLSSFYFLRIEKQKGKRFTKDHLFFGLSLVLLMASDYIPIFFLPVFWLYAIFRKKPKVWWKNFIFSYIPLITFGIIWLPVFSKQILHYHEVLKNLPLWRDVVGGGTLKQLIIFWMKLILGRISFNKALYYPLVLFVSVFNFALLIRSLRKNNFFFILWFFVPITLGLMISFFFPAFNYFRFLYVIPGFILLLVKGAEKMKGGNIFISIILGFNILGLLVYFFDSNQQREDWRGAVSSVEQKASMDSSAIVFNYYLIPAGYRWYTKGYEDVYALSEKKVANYVLSNYDSLYYFDYLEGIYDAENKIRNDIFSSGFSEGEIFDFTGVGQVRYFIKI